MQPNMSCQGLPIQKMFDDEHVAVLKGSVLCKSFSKVPQFGQLIQQLLQVAVGDFVLKAGDERLGFLGIITAQAP